MNRRRFLGTASAAALALTTAPAWLRRAFADTHCPTGADPLSLATLAGAWRRAQGRRRPLLVLVVPEDRARGWDRGAAFGELLNHGSDDQLAPLGLVEVACASMHDLERLVPATPGGEPLAVLVETARVPASARSLDCALPSYPETEIFARTSEDKEDDASERRIGTVARLFAEAIAPGGVTGDVGALAAAVRAQLTHARIPGSHWARASGCGTTVEGVTDGLIMACGMGHVPAKSTRFLDFYTRARRQ